MTSLMPLKWQTYCLLNAYYSICLPLLRHKNEKALKKALVLSDQKQKNAQFNAKFIKFIDLFRQ